MVKTKPMRPLQLFIITGFIALGFASAQAAPGQCVNIFIRAESFEHLLSDMAGYETFLVGRLAQEKNPDLQNVFSTRLAELQELITAALETPPSNGVRLVELARNYEDIVRAVERHRRLVETLAAPKAPPVGNLFQIELTHQAQKEYSDLQKYLQEKYNQFVTEVQAVSDAHQIPIHWRTERLTDYLIEGAPVYSVQLNHGYRVIFTFGQAHTVKIHHISKTFTHGGH